MNSDAQQLRVGVADCIGDRLRGLVRGEAGGTFRRRREVKDVDEAGVEWVCARVRTGREFMVADDLGAIGFRVFAPHGIKVYKNARIGPHGKRGKLERDFPIFTGYVFVGQPKNLIVARRSHPHILDILQNGGMYCRIPPIFIHETAQMWRGGKWDGRASKFSKGIPVRIVRGPMEGFVGVVDSLPTEVRAIVRVAMFGSEAKASIDTEALELV